MKEKQKLEKGLFFSMIFLAVLWRTACAVKHFTHYDDAGLIVSILQSGETIWEKLHYNSVIHWTYAPLQCWIIGLLVNTDYSYEVNLFLGRLPSLLFSIVNIFLVYHLVRKKYSGSSKADAYARIAAVFMISIAWELVVYAAQCEPYSIGLTGLLLLMLEFYHIAETKKITTARLVLTGAVVGYMQYQLFIFVFCFYLAVFALFRKDRKNLITGILCSMFSFFLSLPVIIDFLKNGMLERGMSWNVGIEKQFLFQWDQVEGLDKVIYVFSFLAGNLKVWFRSMFVYKDSTWYADLLALCLIAAAIMGLVYTMKMRDYMNLFLIPSLLLFLILILSGKLAFSPSRHTMIVIPVAIYYIAAFMPFLQQMHKGEIFLRCVFLCYAAIFISTATFFHSEWELRKNRIGTSIVEEWAVKENPIFIGAYGGVFDLALINIAGYEQGYAGIWKTGETLKAGDIMIFYGRARAIEEEDLKILDGYLSGKKLELIDAAEIPCDVEIEYAHNVFSNYGNGFYKYSYRAAGE